MKKLISLVLVTTMLVSSVTSVYGNVSVGNTKISNNTVNIVKFDPTDYEAQIITANGSVVDDANVKNMISSNVVVAVNGGFFHAYYDKNKPITFRDNMPMSYSNIIVDGRLINRGGLQTMIGFKSNGEAIIDDVDVQFKVIIKDGFELKVPGINNYLIDSVPNYFTSEMTLPINLGNNFTGYYIKNGKVVDIVNGGKVTVPKGKDLLVMHNDLVNKYKGYDRNLNIGDNAKLVFSFEPENTNKSDWESVQNALGAGSLIVKNGKNVSSEIKYTDKKQNPNTVLQRSFIGVTRNGELIIGEGSASFNDTANYLINKGVVNAMYLDGGASSMLYADGRYLQNAGRELNNILVFKDTSATARKNDANIILDSKQIEIPAYSIDGNTYFKLRDLAYYFSDTSVGFNINYNKEKNAIEVVSGKPYKKESHKFSESKEKANAKKSVFPTYFNGKEHALGAYVIDGNTYYKLRDIGDILGFNVGWNTELEQIEIKTK